MGRASLTLGSISVTIRLKTVKDSMTVTPAKEKKRKLGMANCAYIELKVVTDGSFSLEELFSGNSSGE
jgi:hypothetical protein